MDFRKQSISYSQTGYYSGIVLDYLNNDEKLHQFYQHFPDRENIEESINARLQYANNREVLADALQQQYKLTTIATEVQQNLELLRANNTLTITTAHQPNIFTGPLYFIYKILHTIKLSAYCKEQFPQYNFVPIYFMGSEDADLDELGHIYLNQEKLEWPTTQKGAVGRMTVDHSLLELINRIESEIGVLPYGKEIMAAVKQSYSKGSCLQNATLSFVNYLFGRYGLLVLIPDNAALKRLMKEVLVNELLHQQSSKIVEATTADLTTAGYKPQASGRKINLFYLKENGERLRIEKRDANWFVVDSNICFNEETLMEELTSHPERFSPNVILRGLFQEIILPNIAFIGGGGELAYWLELKNLFLHYQVPYPMLILRNSFLLIDKSQSERTRKLGFKAEDLFKNTLYLQSQWVKQHSNKDLSITDSLVEMKALFDKLSNQAASINVTLKNHIYALQKQSEKRIGEVGKKFLRAEKRNYDDAMQQIKKLRNQLFPFNSLQERIDNILPYYAIFGQELIDLLYENSYTMEQKFVVLQEE